VPRNPDTLLQLRVRAGSDDNCGSKLRAEQRRQAIHELLAQRPLTPLG